MVPFHTDLQSSSANGQGYWENYLQRIPLPNSATWTTFLLPVDGDLYTLTRCRSLQFMSAPTLTIQMDKAY